MTPTSTAPLPRKRQRRPADSWTPARLAQRWGVSIDKPLGWIRSGKLKAVNVASDGSSKPRWIVTPEALAQFEAARSNTASIAPQKATRRRKVLDYVEYV